MMPAKRKFTLVFVFSLVIAAIMGIASFAGLLYPAILYPSAELLQTFYPNDVVNLLIGLPVLLGSMWLARRRVLAGLLMWPGTLFFVFYNYLIYLFAMPSDVAYILYLALVMLSLYTLIGLIENIDGIAVHQQLSAAVPERLAGGILAGFGPLFLIRAIGFIIVALINQAPLPTTVLALLVTDFLVSPVWVISGVLLWRRNELGYVSG